MKQTKKIGIIGLGYVGSAMHRFFESHYDVIFYDPNKPGTATKEEISACDLVCVCVPTPSKADGACDTSLVCDAVMWITGNPLILIKSTVEPGTTDRLKTITGKRLVFSPEYCGESSYWTPYKFHTDIKETPFFIFGGAPKDTSKCVDFFLRVTGPVKTYRQTTAQAAEMAKYMENTFYATKIAFCYEIATMCERFGIDFNEVRELWLLDPRINPMHTAVFKGNKKPFGGKCLPKDLAALVTYAMDRSYFPWLLQEVQSTNERLEKIRGEM